MCGRKWRRRNSLQDIKGAVKGAETPEESPNANHSFVEEFFNLCLYIYKKPNLYARLSINETGFNHSFIWLVMEFVVDALPEKSLQFCTAEYILKCSKQEYEADACILYGDMELSILETSGKILLNDNSKYDNGHTKIHYGALSILNAIYKKYYWSTEDTAL